MGVQGALGNAHRGTTAIDDTKGQAGPGRLSWAPVRRENSARSPYALSPFDEPGEIGGLNSALTLRRDSILPEGRDAPAGGPSCWREIRDLPRRLAAIGTDLVLLPNDSDAGVGASISRETPTRGERREASRGVQRSRRLKKAEER